LNQDILNKVRAVFEDHFGRSPAVLAYAPGRVEVLGNHTDYNEGFVLSAAINYGTCFAGAFSADDTCHLVAGDLDEECRFKLPQITPARHMSWANYVKGVLAGLQKRGAVTTGFEGVFLGDVPLGAGLSSSAALEMCSGLALSSLYGVALSPIELAKIGQTAEHEYAGVKCGLLDQISSLYGKPDALVMSDFRSLAVESVPLGEEACFLVCNTEVKHALVESEYNERRERCEQAARFFASVLPHPVQALRDVTWDEWQAWQERMDPVVARRAAHVVGENTRVLRGKELLARHDLDAFGRLMFESHESSRVQFENSCPELDLLVNAAHAIPGALGARLSGGGFGGSVVVLVRASNAKRVSGELAEAYAATFGHRCKNMVIRPSAGARLLE